MKLGKFREMTKDLPESTEIISSGYIDEYSPVVAIDTHIYFDPEYGEIFNYSSNAAFNGLEEREWEEIKGRGLVIVLYSR